MVAAFWDCIMIENTQEAGLVPRCRRAAIEKPLYVLVASHDTQGNGGRVIDFRSIVVSYSTYSD